MERKNRKKPTDQSLTHSLKCPWVVIIGFCEFDTNYPITLGMPAISIHKHLHSAQRDTLFHTFYDHKWTFEFVWSTFTASIFNLECRICACVLRCHVLGAIAGRYLHVQCTICVQLTELCSLTTHEGWNVERPYLNAHAVSWYKSFAPRCQAFLLPQAIISLIEAVQHLIGHLSSSDNIIHNSIDMF